MMNYLIYGRSKARQGKVGKHVLRSIYNDRLLVSQT